MSNPQTAKTTEDLLAQLRDAQAAASINMEEVTVKMRPSKSMQRQEAIEALPRLTAAVETATIPSRLIGVFAGGSRLAAGGTVGFLLNNGGIVLDVLDVYGGIAAYAEATYGDSGRDRTFRTTHFARMMSGLRDKAQDLGLTLEGQPVYQEQLCPTADDTLLAVRDHIRTAYGDTFAVAVLRRKIVDAVVSGNLSHKRIPVLVVNSREEERAGLGVLFSRTRTFEFTGDFKPTEESVTAIFKGK